MTGIRVLTLLALAAALLFAHAGPAAAQTKAPSGPVPAGAAAQTLGKTNLRSRAGGGAVLRRLRAGTPVRALCTKVGGLARTRADGLSRVWVRVKVGKRRGWVHDALINPTRGALIAPICGAPTADGPQLPGVDQGTCAIRPEVPLLPPYPTFAAFIAAALPAARTSRERTEVPVSVTLAQGILETGGGKSSALGNNYFGIKARVAPGVGQYSWGPYAVGCTMIKTREAERSGLVLTVGAFRAYRTLRESILDHGNLLTSNPVYAPAFKYTDSPKRFLREIAKRYATDPGYATKLLSLIDRYDLARYDERE